MAKPFLLRLDWIVVLATLGVVAVGLPFLHSASPSHYQKQCLWMALGVVAMIAIIAVDYELLIRYAYEIYGAALALLLLVLAMPHASRGSLRWIPVALPGFKFNIQPTEIMKLALVLVLARHLRHRESQSTLRGLIIPFLLTLAPMGLLLKQPDLGSAIVLPPLLFAVVFASGARVLHLAAIAFTGALSCIPMWLFLMANYQKRRILAFLNPEQYEAREAYQLIMSKIAIGSGGVFGEGLGNGTISELDLLPDMHTDFIFGVIGLEGGFLIAALQLAFYLIIILGGLHIARNCREPGGQLIAAGITAVFGTQVLMNVGVVTALLPTTGIPLPLVSYGGSSLVVTFTMIGLLLHVGASRPLILAPEAFTGQSRGK